MPQVMEADAGQASPLKQRKEAPLPQIVRVQRPTDRLDQHIAGIEPLPKPAETNTNDEGDNDGN